MMRYAHAVKNARKKDYWASMTEEIDILLQAVQEAGAAILALQKTDFAITKKPNSNVNNDLLTQADLLANEIIKTRLLTAFPGDGWLSEESVDDSARLTCERVWIVDPIDGTREYASRIAEYAISVALVESGTPILSAVFNPASNELFHAIKGKGAWLGSKKIHCNGTLLPSETGTETLLLLASRSEYQRGEWKNFQQYHRVKQVGSIAYKLALVAAGQSHATFSLGPKNEWDIAAGALLVTEAGGIVTNKHREKIIFNRKEVKVDGIVATAAEVNDAIFALIERVYIVM
jgi:myo-inositol-1(or 4)-monophosphatase